MGQHSAQGHTTVTRQRNGTDGLGITKVEEQYARHTAPDTAPTSGWQDAPPQLTTTYRYLWNRERMKYSDGTYSSWTTPAMIGSLSEDGVSITGVTEHYLITAVQYSGTNKPPKTDGSHGTWTTDPGAAKPTEAKPYLWNYETIHRSNNISIETQPALIGMYSSDGDSLEAQYAPNSSPAAADIHDTFTTGDKYMRTKKTSETQWSSWVKIVGENGKETNYTFNISKSLTSTNASTPPANCYLATWADAPRATTSDYPYLWAKVEKKNENGTTTSTSYIRLTGEPGAAGTSMQVQYAPNSSPAAADIHDTFTTGDKYMRTRNSNETNWSSWQLIVGEAGTNGSYIDYAFGISKQLTTASVNTAPTILGTWADAPRTTTTAYPYLWCRMIPVSSSGTRGTAKYIRITGEKGADGTSVTIKGTVDEWREDTTGYEKLDGEVWAINTPHSIYYWDESQEQFITKTPSAGDGYIVNNRTQGSSYIYDGHLLVSNGTSWIDAGKIKGDPGENGSQVYFHIAYANKDSNGNIIDFTNDDTASAGREWQGTYSDYVQEDAAADSSLWQWHRIKGNDNFTIYKAAFSQPAKPTPANYIAGGWTKTPPTQPEIGISHGGTWSQIADGSYQSPETEGGGCYEERFELLTTADNQVLSMEIRASSEANYDIGYIGQLDSTDPYNNPLAEVSGTEKTAIQVTIPTAGRHFIVVAYEKDDSAVANEDCVRVKIGKRPLWMCTATAFDSNGKPTAFSTPVPISDQKAEGDTITTKPNILPQTRFRNSQRMAVWDVTGGEIQEGLGSNKSYYGKKTTSSGVFELLRCKLFQQGAIARIKNETWYTFSFWAKGNGTLNTYIYPSAIDTAQAFYIDGVAQTSRPTDGYHQWTLDSRWKRHTVTFKTKAAYATSQRFAADEFVLFRLVNQNNFASILMPKLEEGMQATTYQMNDDDIEGVTGKMLYPGGVYDSGTRYVSDEYTTPFVSIAGTKEYYWLNADSSQGEDPRTSPKWRKATYFQVVIAEALVAAFGKIGAAVFWHNYMMSQYGQAHGSQSDEYQRFDEQDIYDESGDFFCPNILMNFYTGYAHFAHGNVRFNADGSGQIGGFKWDSQGRIERMESTKTIQTETVSVHNLIGDVGLFNSLSLEVKSATGNYNQFGFAKLGTTRYPLKYNKTTGAVIVDLADPQ